MNDSKTRPVPPIQAVDDDAPRSAPGAFTGTPVAVVEEDGLRRRLLFLLENWRIILATACAGLLAGALYGALAERVYESETLIQVEDRASMGAAVPGGLSGLFELNTTAETEMEILRSRTLLGAAVDDLDLDLRAEPRYFPFLGKAAARWSQPAAPRKPLFGPARFAWGGEHIRLDHLRVPAALAGQPLRLVAGAGGAFDLLDPEGENKLLSGRVGTLASAPSGTQERIEVLVTALTAREGTEFLVQKLNPTIVVGALRSALSISEQGRKTGIIRIALRGDDPAQVTSALNRIAQRYLRRNVERKSAEAEKTLEFIDGQLPQLRTNLEVAEEALNKYRAANTRADVSIETRGLLDRLVEVEKEATTVQLQQSDVQQRFKPGHPVMAATRDKLAQLQTERSAIDARLKRLPRAELESARLMRDVKVANELYILLLNKSQETQVLKSGAVGNVIIVDPAVEPLEPIAPQGARALVLALILGVAAGVGLALARRSLVGGLSDPEQIERELGLPVYASIPHSRAQGGLMRRRRRRAGAESAVLATSSTADPAVEAIRSLRTSVEFALSDARNNVVNITGPSPGIGKTFVSVNLAHVLADAGHNVLLVDADLRKGNVGACLGVEEDALGLSDVIQGTTTEDGAIRETRSERLWAMTRGRVPPNPSELLTSRRFKEVVRRLSEVYDVVILDSAPVLAVTDGVLVGRTAGTNLVVLRAGQHPLREILTALKQLSQNGVEPHALVLNDVTQEAAGGSRYYLDYKSDPG